MTWDGANRRIYLKSGVSDYFPIEDLYHEYRNARRTDESLRKFDGLLKAEGNVSKGAGAFTPRYVVLLDGTKIIPFDESLQINQLGDIITDDPDTDPTLYDISGLTTAKPIFIKPSEAETIQLNSEAIVFSSFQGSVWYDVNSPYSDKGSAILPNGNTERPINNMVVGLEIAVELGLNRVTIVSDTVTLNEDFSAGYRIEGTSPFNVLVANPIADLTKCAIVNLTASGEFDGINVLQHSRLGNVTDVSGLIDGCSIGGDIHLNGEISIVNCTSDIEGAGYATIYAASGFSIQVRGYKGSMGIASITSGSHSIGGSEGRCVIEASNTGGKIHVRGSWFEIVDNSGAGCTVIDERGTTTKESIASAVHDEIIEGTMTHRESVRLQNSVMFGKVSGAGTVNEIFRDIADTKDRVAVTVDASGNRTNIILDGN